MKSKQRCVASMLSMIVIAFTIAGCGGSIPAPTNNATAQTTVTLQGQLTDAATGEPIVGAKIDIGSRTATTNSNGHYEIANVAANSGSSVARDYQATITLTAVTSPVDMTNPNTTMRYPDRKFTAPVTPTVSPSANHDFKVGKLSATISGVVGDSSLLPVGSASVELQDNTASMAGTVIRSATADAVTGAYSFANVEAGVDYKLVGHSSDGSKQGNITTGKLYDDQTLNLSLGTPNALVLSSTDTYAPRIVQVSPENNADVAPSSVDVVFTFNEPILQNAYSTPNPSAVDNIYHDIDVSYGGKKAAGNFAHTLSWNATFDALTISLPETGTSSKFTIDLSLLSPGVGAAGKLKDIAGNGMESSSVLSAGNTLTFSTNGGVPAVTPVILSPDAAGLNWDATGVTLDWQPAVGATNGYNVYRSAGTSAAPGVTDPFVLIAGPITASNYIDNGATGFNLQPFPEIAQSYVYRVTSINSDLIESAPSNEISVTDVILPTIVAGGICVPPGATVLNVTANGQIKLNFSEPMDVVSAETISNYVGANISAASLTSPTTVVLDFSAPISCASAHTITISSRITDVAGNALAGSLVHVIP